MNKSFEEEFDCLGQFFDAANIRKFRKVLNTAIQQTLDQTTVSVELLDKGNNPVVTNVNVTFINSMTKEPVYDFVHYRDRQGRPDSVEIDAVLGYDLMVNTVPGILKKDIKIIPGRHNVLKVNAPQGQLTVLQPGHTEYKKGVKFIVRKQGQRKILHVQDINTKEDYLIGKYDLEILTLPKILVGGVEIEQGKVNEIKVPNPGVMNLYANVKGFGSLYAIDENGKQSWVKNLDRNKTRFTMAIQPGDYKLVFRAENAFGSKYTTIKNFTIKSGTTTNIKLIGG